MESSTLCIRMVLVVIDQLLAFLQIHATKSGQVGQVLVAWPAHSIAPVNSLELGGLLLWRFRIPGNDYVCPLQGYCRRTLLYVMRRGLIDLGLVRSGTSASATFTATPTCDAICWIFADMHWYATLLTSSWAGESTHTHHMPLGSSTEIWMKHTCRRSWAGLDIPAMSNQNIIAIPSWSGQLWLQKLNCPSLCLQLAFKLLSLGFWNAFLLLRVKRKAAKSTTVNACKCTK